MLGTPYTNKAYSLFHQATKTLADIECRGIRIDTQYLQETMEEKEQQLCDDAERFFTETELGRLWKKEFKRKAEITNNNQLGTILFGRMGVKSKKETKGGKASTDNSVLQHLAGEVDGAELLLSIKKLDKGLHTFLEGIRRETTDGRLHPMFSLNIARTYRSSSQAPNFQNFPIRDPEIGKMIRNTFIPEDNWFFGEADYSGLEVHIGACYHKDKKMIAYLEDPSLDMHRDMAQELFFLPRNLVNKKIRYSAKNGFVFPEFYGSFYEDVSKELWEMIDSLGLMLDGSIPLKRHLRGKGIKTLKDFTEHVKRVESSFWNDRFPRYTDWKEEQYNNYLKKGYFVSKTGFIYQGLMRRNQVINFPVQGSAFHCLLWSLIHVNREFKRKKMRSHLVGQIHDSMIPIIHPNEIEDVFKIIHRVSCEDLRKKWKWINIPLKVEFDLAPQGKSWFYKKEIEYENGVLNWNAWKGE